MASMSTPRIVVVGSTMIDLIAYADRLPGDGETVIGSSYETGFGGKGANQAVMAARFGAEVAMVNTLGDDGHGTAYLERLRAEGIDTTWMRRVAGSSGVAPIWVDRAGTNRIVVPGANGEVRPDVAAEAVEAFRPQAARATPTGRCQRWRRTRRTTRRSLRRTRHARWRRSAGRPRGGRPCRARRRRPRPSDAVDTPGPVTRLSVRSRSASR
jgi:hypothetical protein